MGRGALIELSCDYFLKPLFKGSDAESSYCKYNVAGINGIRSNLLVRVSILFFRLSKQIIIQRTKFCVEAYLLKTAKTKNFKYRTRFFDNVTLAKVNYTM